MQELLSHRVSIFPQNKGNKARRKVVRDEGSYKLAEYELKNHSIILTAIFILRTLIQFIIIVKS